MVEYSGSGEREEHKAFFQRFDATGWRLEAVDNQDATAGSQS
jgi:hypothetical protein